MSSVSSTENGFDSDKYLDYKEWVKKYHIVMDSFKPTENKMNKFLKYFSFALTEVKKKNKSDCSLK